MVIEACSPRKPMWPWEYIEYTLELREQYDAGIIDKNELRKLLLRKFPDEPIPDDGTMRYWEQKYSSLLEKRRQFLRDQGIRPAGLQEQPVLASDAWRLEPGVMGYSGEPYRVNDLFRSVMPFVAAFMVLYLVASMSKCVAALWLD